MERADAEATITGLYRYLLRREPGLTELGEWIEVALAGASVSQIIDKFGSSTEYSLKNQIVPFSARAITILRLSNPMIMSGPTCWLRGSAWVRRLRAST